jgi:hypothetical protein
VSEQLDRGARKVAHGRSDDTPVILHAVLFAGIGIFVAVVVLVILLIYYLV